MIETTEKSFPLFFVLYQFYTVSFRSWACLVELTESMNGLLHFGLEALLFSLVCM